MPDQPSQHGSSSRAARYEALDFRALNSVTETLGADITRCMDEGQAIIEREGRRDQFWARTLVRTSLRGLKRILSK